MLDGRRWAQGELLSAGLARVRTTPEDRALAAEMLRLEARARVERRGLWREPAWRVRLPHEVEAGFVLVEGRVRRTTRTGRGVRLEFGAARGDLAAEIPRAALAEFQAAGREPAAMQGRLLRLRGVARPTRWGPTIHLDHPEQLEPLREARPARRSGRL